MGDAARVLTQSEIDKLFELAGDAKAIPRPEKEDIYICKYCKKIMHFKGVKIMLNAKEVIEVPYILLDKQRHCQNMTGHFFVSWLKLETLKW